MMDLIIYRGVLLCIGLFSAYKAYYHFNRAYKNSNYYKNKKK